MMGNRYKKMERGIGKIKCKKVTLNRIKRKRNLTRSKMKRLQVYTYLRGIKECKKLEIQKVQKFKSFKSHDMMN